MCGIAAILRSWSAPTWSEAWRARLEQGISRLERRGPDGSGRSETARALLGHTRLAIQDLSDAGLQPMSTADGGLSITYNGEIYNASELREVLRREGCEFRSRSDTEVLLHALDRWGVDNTLARVRGMFAFVAVRRDTQAIRVMAAVDAAGMKPLAWAWREDPERRGERVLVVSSECDAMRAMLPERPALNVGAVRRMLRSGYIGAPETVWEGVHKLGAGEMLEWSGRPGEPPIVTRYWAPPPLDVRGRHDSEFTELLEHVMAEHLIGDVPVGMFLSAGMDSSSIALALRNAGAELGNVRAFTLSAGEHADESTDAVDAARRLGMPHTVVRFAPGDLLPTLRAAAERYDEPQGYTAILTATRIADALRWSAPDAKVVLGGDGGDEALAGYAWHRDEAAHPFGLGSFKASSSALAAERALADRVAGHDANDRERLEAIVALGACSFVDRYRGRIFGGFHPAEARALVVPDAGDDDAWADPLLTMDDATLPMPRRAQRLDVTGFCAGSIVPKLDRSCMGVGLELRAPYLDRRMIEWGLSRPVDANEHEAGGGKLPIRAMLLRSVESGLLSRSVLERPKQGFSLRLPDEQFESLLDVVARSRARRDGVIGAHWMHYLTQQPEMRRTRLFTLAMLAAWYDHRS